MPRKTKTQEDQSGWRMPSLYAFVGEYGPFKARGHDPIANALVWLCNSGEADDDDGEGQPRRHAMYPLAAPIQDLLLGERDEGGGPRFTSVLAVDVRDMFESREEYREALETENERVDPTKKFGKKLLRLFQKLLLHRAALAAAGELCTVLLKLYRSLEAIDAAYESETISELWQLRPRLSAKYVDTHWTVAGPSHNTYPAQLNLVRTSSAADEVSALGPFFPVQGTEIVVDGEVRSWFSVVARRRDLEASPGPYDPARRNSLGKALFVSQVKVEMNRFSKQYERNCVDITSDLMTIFETKPNCEDYPHAVDWSTCEKHVGALLLRGDRCVLVRSTSGEWEGMRIPSLVSRPGEDPREAAIRAATEFTGVDAGEMRALPHVLPVAIYAPDGRPIMVEVYPLYATSAPPDYVEDAQNDLGSDPEDEDDPYDWYTFPRATARLDEASAAALRTMASTLMQASSVGLVPSKWGGVFGQELQLRDSGKAISVIA